MYSYNLYLLVNNTFRQPFSRKKHTFVVRKLILPDIVFNIINFAFFKLMYVQFSIQNVNVFFGQFISN